MNGFADNIYENLGSERQLSPQEWADMSAAAIANKNKNNTSGFTGLKWYPRLGKWGVFVGKKYLGVFYNKELAVAARESYICNNPLLGYTMEHGV